MLRYYCEKNEIRFTKIQDWGRCMRKRGYSRKRKLCGVEAVRQLCGGREPVCSTSVYLVCDVPVHSCGALQFRKFFAVGAAGASLLHRCFLSACQRSWAP